VFGGFLVFKQLVCINELFFYLRKITCQSTNDANAANIMVL
jgi:hypothetical protein